MCVKGVTVWKYLIVCIWSYIPFGSWFHCDSAAAFSRMYASHGEIENWLKYTLFCHANIGQMKLLHRKVYIKDEVFLGEARFTFTL